VSDIEDVAAVLSEAVLLDASPQADALGEAVAEHLATRPVRERKPVDPDVLDKLRRKEQP
jgi:hypothetical protein